MRRGSISKVVFVLSFGVLAFMYGFATSARQWFPNDFMVRAWSQVEEAVLSPPDWVNPRVHHRAGATMLDPGAADSGLTLVAMFGRRESGWQPGLKLLESDGEVAHEWWIEPGESFSGAGLPPITSDFNIHGSRLLPDGDVVLNVNYVGTLRIDACSRVKWRLAANNHHSVARASDGSFWIPGISEAGASEERPGFDGYPGLDSNIYYDRLLRVTSGGTVVEDLRVLDLLYENGLEDHIPRAGEVKAKDVTHLNDIEPLPGSLAGEYPMFDEGDLLVSLRELDLVFVVDPESRRVKWHSADFIQQHDPDFVGDGWIGVFDNNWDGTERGTMLGGSRIVLVQPHTDSTMTVFPTERSQRFYTPFGGKWQRLDNGNLLLTETLPGRILEVAPNGEAVWEWVHPPYDGSSVPQVSEGTRYDLISSEVASWPCSPN